MKLNAKRAIIEFSSIVIAVILAMSLSEARQNYLNDRLAEKSFENIVLEVQKNREDLKADSVKISKDLAFIQQWISDVMEKRKPETFNAGFSFSFLNTSAMEVAEINKSLAFLSTQKNMDIAEIYATQKFYSEHGAKMFDVMGELVGQISNPNLSELLPDVFTLRFHLNIIKSTIKAYMVESSSFLEKYAIAEASD